MRASIRRSTTQSCIRRSSTALLSKQNCVRRVTGEARRAATEWQGVGLEQKKANSQPSRDVERLAIFAVSGAL